MAESAIAAAATTEDTPEAPETGGELRDRLIATVKEKSAEKARAAGEPEKAKPAAEKPKADAKKPEPPKAKDGPEEKPEEGDAEIRAKRKALSKFSRKLESREVALNTREEQVKLSETRAQHEHHAFLKDPIGWLRSRKVDVRAVLLQHAQEDAEDPKEKRIRELAEEQKASREKLEALERDKAKEAAERSAGEAFEKLQRGVKTEFEAADAQDYPLLATLSTPEKVAFYGARHMRDHWIKTAKRDAEGKLYDGEELAPAEVFAILEAELRAHEARSKATGKKPEPPDRVRADKTAIPETSRETRSARDVTNRTARVRTSADEAPSGKTSLDRDKLREKLVGMAREHVR